MPVEISSIPLPSRSTSTSTEDSLVTRSTRPVRGPTPMRFPPCGFMASHSQAQAVSWRPTRRLGDAGPAKRLEERIVLAVQPRGDPEPARQAHVAHEHTAVEQALPDGGLVVEPAEQHEVRVRGHGLAPL